MKAAINTQLLHEQIEAALKEEIFSGRLLPSQRVSIEQLARQVGTSYTPVRDAVKRLSAIGMMRVCPRKEVRVEQLGEKKLKDLFEVRIALETTAIQTAVTRIPGEALDRASELLREAERRLREQGDATRLRRHDGLVHELILQHCDNALLVPMLQGVLDLCMWAHRSIVRIDPGVADQGAPEHLEILRAIIARKVAAAKRALVDHLKNTLQRTLQNSSSLNP